MGSLDRRIEKLEKEDAEFEAAVLARFAAVREQCERLDMFSWLDETLPVEMSREHAAEGLVRWLALADEFESRLEGEIANPDRRRDEAVIRAEMRMGASRADAEALLADAARDEIPASEP